jgi:hypothetical protein
MDITSNDVGNVLKVVEKTRNIKPLLDLRAVLIDEISKEKNTASQG